MPDLNYFTRCWWTKNAYNIHIVYNLYDIIIIIILLVNSILNHWERKAIQGLGPYWYFIIDIFIMLLLFTFLLLIQ